MRRKLFTLAAGASAVVCVAVCVLWARSYRISDLFLLIRPYWGAFVQTADGDFRIELLRVVDHRYPNHPVVEHGTDKTDGSGVFPDRIPGQWVHFRGHGFALVTGERWNDYHHALFAPGWFIALLAALLPSAWCLTRFARATRNVSGFCPSCGYDLRATPDRCPECGTAAGGAVR